MNPFRRVTPFEAVLLVCCLAIAGCALFLAFAGGSNYLGSLDYRVYLTAGKMALGGAGEKFYDLPTQFAAQRALWPQMTRQDQLLPFLAPPFVALPFAPLALLPPLLGYAVWTLGNALLLFGIARGGLAALEREGRSKLVALALILTFTPVLFGVMQGQVSLWVVLGFWQSYQSAKAGRDFQAGLWLSLLLIRPQLAFLPLLIFAGKGRFKLLGGFGLGALFLGLISLALVGVEGLKNYAHLLGAVAGWQNRYGVQPAQMQTFRGFLHAIFSTNDFAAIRIWWLGGLLFALGALLLCWRGPWETQNPRFERGWAALGIGALFCCPYLYSHDLSLLVACGVLICRAPGQQWLPLLGYATVLSWALALLIWPHTYPWVALFEALSLAILAAQVGVGAGVGSFGRGFQAPQNGEG